MRKIFFSTMMIFLSVFFQFAYTSKASADCMTPWGGSVMEGFSITAYQWPHAPMMGYCTSENRMCMNGNLMGTYMYSSCQPDMGCQTVFGYIPHGQSKIAFLRSMENGGVKCKSEIRYCNNRFFSGSYSNASCFEYP